MANITNTKIVVCGAPKAGKTTYVQKLIGPSILATDFTVYLDVSSFEFNGEKYSIWDTKWEEGPHRGLGDAYFVRGKGFIVMFDLTNKESLKMAMTTLTNVKRVIRGKNIPVIICGTKCECESEFSDEERQKIKEQFEEKNIKYFEISSETGHNVRKPFEELAKMIE